MLTSLQQLKSPAIFCKSPPTLKISDSPVLAQGIIANSLLVWVTELLAKEMADGFGKMC